MRSSSKIAEPSKNVIDKISSSLISAVAEANQGNSRLRCTSLADPNRYDGVQLAEQIRALQLARTVIKRSLDQHIADARRHRNALQPVNKLPAEVLSVIFHQSLTTVSVHNHFTSLFVIARVSARWKFVVDSTPSLWSFISSTYPASQVERALQMSARTPISVACSFIGDALTSTSKYGSRDFLQKMQSTGRQWDELSLHLPSIGHLRKVLEAPAPYVRKLDIEVAYPSSDSVNIFGGRRGVLEDVKLTTARIEWDSEALTGLRRLQLDYREGDEAGPTLTEILWLLQRSPRLRSFSWSGRSLQDSPDSVMVDTITLPYLSSLSLRGITVPGASKVLASIHAPSCHHLTLHCKSEVGDTPLLSQLQRFVPVLRESLNYAPISMCLGPSSFHYHHVSTNPNTSINFDFKFEGTKPYLLLDWFSQHLYDSNHNSPPVNIRFDPRFDFTRDDSIFPALLRLRTAASLTIADRVVGPCRLLEWLSRPDGSRGVGSYWPFPLLRELVIGQSNLLVQDILDFVCRRYVEYLPIFSREGPPRLLTLRLVGRGWQGRSARHALEEIMLGADFKVQRSSWVHVPCQVNEDPLDVGDIESASDTDGSSESSSEDSETGSEMVFSDTSESESSELGSSEDETGEE
ncbi:hypothetical protein FS837_012710 [Tulasnella sp. UAMH 9824]|nr:hypothetical protein FS837_012710 [Tulasnella sp. UAMH 9824]